MGDMFTGINEAICARAWAMIEPAIDQAVANGIFNGPNGALAVLNPADPNGKPLFVASIGEAGNFPEYAANKARLAHRVQMDTTSLRHDLAHLYRPGDIKWPGGIWRDGLAVGFIGVQGEYDVMIGEWFGAAVKAVCRLEFFGEQGQQTQPTPYLGRTEA